jgi:hypothetical protein
MDTFEDENPFEGEGDRNIHSDTSSSSKLNVSEPSSPTISFAPSPLANEYLATSAATLGSAPSHSKGDHWLQSGEDVEILVSSS